MSKQEKRRFDLIGFSILAAFNFALFLSMFHSFAVDYLPYQRSSSENQKLVLQYQREISAVGSLFGTTGFAAQSLQPSVLRARVTEALSAAEAAEFKSNRPWVRYTEAASNASEKSHQNVISPAAAAYMLEQAELLLQGITTENESQFAHQQLAAEIRRVLSAVPNTSGYWAEIRANSEFPVSNSPFEALGGFIVEVLIFMLGSSVILAYFACSSWDKLRKLRVQDNAHVHHHLVG